MYEVIYVEQFFLLYLHITERWQPWFISPVGPRAIYQQQEVQWVAVETSGWSTADDCKLSTNMNTTSGAVDRMGAQSRHGVDSSNPGTRYLTPATGILPCQPLSYPGNR